MAEIIRSILCRLPEPPEVNSESWQDSPRLMWAHEYDTWEEVVAMLAPNKIEIPCNDPSLDNHHHYRPSRNSLLNWTDDYDWQNPTYKSVWWPDRNSFPSISAFDVNGKKTASVATFEFMLNCNQTYIESCQFPNQDLHLLYSDKILSGKLEVYLTPNSANIDYGDHVIRAYAVCEKHRGTGPNSNYDFSAAIKTNSAADETWVDLGTFTANHNAWNSIDLSESAIDAIKDSFIVDNPSIHRGAYVSFVLVDENLNSGNYPDVDHGQATDIGFDALRPKLTLMEISESEPGIFLDADLMNLSNMGETKRINVNVTELTEINQIEWTVNMQKGFDTYLNGSSGYYHDLFTYTVVAATSPGGGYIGNGYIDVTSIPTPNPRICAALTVNLSVTGFPDAPTSDNATIWKTIDTPQANIYTSNYSNDWQVSENGIPNKQYIRMYSTHGWKSEYLVEDTDGQLIPGTWDWGYLINTEGGPSNYYENIMIEPNPNQESRTIYIAVYPYDVTTGEDFPHNSTMPHLKITQAASGIDSTFNVFDSHSATISNGGSYTWNCENFNKWGDQDVYTWVPWGKHLASATSTTITGSARGDIEPGGADKVSTIVCVGVDDKHIHLTITQIAPAGYVWTPDVSWISCTQLTPTTADINILSENESSVDRVGTVTVTSGVEEIDTIVITQEGKSLPQIKDYWIGCFCSSSTNGAIFSKDGGQTWDTVAETDHKRGGILRKDSNLVFATGYGNTFRILHDDVWYNHESIDVVSKVGYMGASTDGQYLLTGGWDPAHYFSSRDYGHTWEDITVASNDRISAVCVSPNGQYAVFADHSYNIYYNHNYLDPTSWVDSGVNATYHGTSISMYNDGKDVVVRSRPYHDLKVSTDYGVTYTTLASPDGNDITMNGLEYGKTVVGQPYTFLSTKVGSYYSKLYKLVDTTFTLVHTGGGTTNVFTTINPMDATKAYLFDGTKIFKSTNSGDSFSEAADLGVTLIGISISSDGLALLSNTSSGLVYVSLDEGTTWNQVADLSIVAGAGTYYAVAID